MGAHIQNMLRTSPLINSYNQDQWELKEQFRYFTVLRNKKLAIHSDCYQLPATQFQKNIEIYQNRRPGAPQTRDIVWVYHVVLQQNDYLCNKENYIKVLTEHIPLKLTLINNLQESEALGVLKSALSGYHYLSQQYQCPEPTQNCIGFNQTGKAKVWMNQNYALNAPRVTQQKETRQINSIQTENQDKRNRYFVKLLFDAISKHTKSFNTVFVEYFQINKPNYEQGIHAIEDYAEKNKVRIAPIIGSKHFQSGKYNLKVYHDTQQNHIQNKRQDWNVSRISNFSNNLNKNMRRVQTCNGQISQMTRVNSDGSLPIFFRNNQSVEYQHLSYLRPIQNHPNINIQQQKDQRKYLTIKFNNTPYQNRPLQRVHSNHAFINSSNKQSLRQFSKCSQISQINTHNTANIVNTSNHQFQSTKSNNLLAKVGIKNISNAQGPLNKNYQGNICNQISQQKGSKDENNARKQRQRKMQLLFNQQKKQQCSKQAESKEQLIFIQPTPQKIDSHSTNQDIEAYIRRKYQKFIQQKRQDQKTKSSIQVKDIETQNNPRQFTFENQIGRGEPQLGRHDLMTFMPTDKLSNDSNAKEMKKKLEALQQKQLDKHTTEDLSVKYLQNKLIKYTQSQLNKKEIQFKQQNIKIQKQYDDSDKKGANKYKKSTFDKQYYKITSSIDQKYQKYVNKKQSTRNKDTAHEINENKFLKYREKRAERYQKQNSHKDKESKNQFIKI